MLKPHKLTLSTETISAVTKSKKSCDKRAFLFSYILLKIQSGDWAENQKIPSERNLAKKFNFSASIIHSVLIQLKNLKVISSTSQSSWHVCEKHPENILGYDPYHHPYEVIFLTNINPVKPDTANSFNLTDFKILEEISLGSKINAQNYYFFQKNYYQHKHNQISHSIEFGINPKRIDFMDRTLMGADLSKFLANNGLAIIKRIKKIVCLPQKDFNESPKTQQMFQIFLYNITFDQFGDIIFISKTRFYDYDGIKTINYTYTL